VVLPAAAMAIAFGPHLPDADWMPIATLVAMQPSLQQSALVAVGEGHHLFGPADSTRRGPSWGWKSECTVGEAAGIAATSRAKLLPRRRAVPPAAPPPGSYPGRRRGTGRPAEPGNHAAGRERRRYTPAAALALVSLAAAAIASALSSGSLQDWRGLISDRFRTGFRVWAQRGAIAPANCTTQYGTILLRGTPRDGVGQPEVGRAHRRNP